MKYLKLIFIPVLLFIIGVTISCERDDICPDSTPTTPKLIIDLYDFENSENLKNAANLVVAGVTNTDERIILPDYNFVTSSDLILPLKTTEDMTQYVVVKDASVNDNDTPDDLTDDFVDGNFDTITITYDRREVYVSRACGFKTIFENVEVIIEDDGNKWLLGTPENLTDNEPIENEDATHFNLFH